MLPEAPLPPLLYIVGKTGEAVEAIDLSIEEVGSNCDGKKI
jgi:hypothetical protein